MLLPYTQRTVTERPQGRRDRGDRGDRPERSERRDRDEEATLADTVEVTEVIDADGGIDEIVVEETVIEEDA